MLPEYMRTDSIPLQHAETGSVWSSRSRGTQESNKKNVGETTENGESALRFFLFPKENKEVSFFT